MKLLNLASNRSFWRGIEYHHEKRVLSWNEIDKNCYQGKVKDSNEAVYNVKIDLEHPKNRRATVHLLLDAKLFVNTWLRFVLEFFLKKSSKCWIISKNRTNCMSKPMNRK